MTSELFYFILGAGLNLLVALFIVRFIYYPKTQDKTYVFTFLAFNTVIYFVLGLLTSAELSVGVGFGLFAIFSVLRYRTDEMPIREMTYLFILIALPVMNSVMISNTALSYLLVANGSVLAVLFALEKEWGFHFAGSKRVMYDRIDLIAPTHEARLLADLRERTGLMVERVEVRRIDFLHDTADLTIFYEEPRSAKATTAPRLFRQGAQL
jgi:hypothetical protein